MNRVADCTVPEKILLAAYHLEQQGQTPFSAEALIVASWQKFPRAFGLKGFADQYPDSNKVLTSIMGEKGLTRKGWLAKMGQKLYSMSKEGRQVAKGLLDEEDGAPSAPAAPVSSPRPAKEQEKYLLNLLHSPALEKFQQGLKLELTFSEACRYWGITENLRGEAVDGRLDKLRTFLADLEKQVKSDTLDLSTGRSVTREDVKLLREVDEHLTDRFGRHLTLLRNRSSS